MDVLCSLHAAVVRRLTGIDDHAVPSGAGRSTSAATALARIGSCGLGAIGKSSVVTAPRGQRLAKDSPVPVGDRPGRSTIVKRQEARTAAAPPLNQ